MKPNELFKDIQILDCSPGAIAKARGMPVCDSRLVSNGCVFTCIKGRDEDGHEHIREAVSKGAAVIVTESEVSHYGSEYVRVNDTREAFAKMCSAACGDPGGGLHLAAVTGTNGKSSVACILSHILNSCGEKAAVIGTIEHSMTTPSPELLYPELKKLVGQGVKYVAMEASSHALDQKRLVPLRFDVGAYTNLTAEHLDYHLTMSDYAAAKAKLFELSSVGVFCAESEEARICAEKAGRKKYLYGIETGDIRAENIIGDYCGSQFELCFPGKKVSVRLPLAGRFQVLNSVAASSCAYVMGADAKDIANALCNVPSVSGRLEKIDTAELGFKVFIDYAHTPDALANAINSLRACMKKGERLCVIFGCGGDRDRLKRPAMGNVVSYLADSAIVTSDNPRSEDPYGIIREIVSDWQGGAKRIIIEERTQAVEYAIASAREGDVLLFCGKGHEEYTIDKNGKHKYNEKTAVQNAIARRNKDG